MPGSSRDALKGGYVIDDSAKEVPDVILMASGSEVELAVEAKKLLAKVGLEGRESSCKHAMYGYF